MEEFWKFFDGKSINSLIETAGLIVTLLVFWFGRKRKSFSYNVVSNEQLVNVKDEVARRIEFLLDGAPVKDVRLFLFEVENTGNESILEKDYERPFSITFSEQATIISAEILSTKPARILGPKDGLKISGSRLELPSCLLNPSDRLLIKVLLKEHNGAIAVDARIAGVKELQSTRRWYAALQTKIPLIIAALISCLIFLTAHDVLIRLHFHSYAAFIAGEFACIASAVVITVAFFTITVPKSNS